MRSKTIITILCAALLLISTDGFAKDELMLKSQEIFKPIPKNAPIIKDKEFTMAKADLGKKLYFDPRLSASGLISCNTCHNIGMGGVDFQETSTGHGWQKGPRNAPTVLNSVFNLAQFWDGRAADLKEQAKGPVQASVEMNNKPEDVVTTLNTMSEYVELFKEAFPNDKDPVNFDNMADAIEAFEATLITPDSKFDKYLRGNENALSQTEKEGLKLFIDKNCTQCHSGINMGGTGYYPFGFAEKPKDEIVAGDKGRFAVTKTKSDEYVFKSPSLRNIELTGPYFHSGKIWNLTEAVKVMSSAQLGISLSDDEADKIVTFLRSTTGTQPKVEYPILPAPSNETPKPKL
ncbi:cytochrome c551 peroxidase [Candidatus Magnetoovum chiemensis]|nr:cytochrome c551 peroxidase [Candidatus Magnetoovum chiemensis]